jgi:hypothetical protein
MVDFPLYLKECYGFQVVEQEEPVSPTSWPSQWSAVVAGLSADSERIRHMAPDISATLPSLFPLPCSVTANITAPGGAATAATHFYTWWRWCSRHRYHL